LQVVGDLFLDACPYAPHKQIHRVQAARHPEVVARMKTLLEDWRRYAIAARLPSDAETTETMSSEELERLRSLGYIQ